MRKYKLFAFYAPKDFEVNVFDKTFDFSIIEDKEEVVIIYDELYTNYNVCRFDLLAIQKLLKGQKDVKRNRKKVTKEEFVPRKILNFAIHHTFNSTNCELDATRQDLLEYGEQTANFRAFLGDINFYMVIQKIIGK